MKVTVGADGQRGNGFGNRVRARRSPYKSAGVKLFATTCGWLSSDPRMMLAVCRDALDTVHNVRGDPHVPGNDLMFRTSDAPS